MKINSRLQEILHCWPIPNASGMHTQWASRSIFTLSNPNFEGSFFITNAILLPREFVFEATMSRSEEVQDLNT